MRKKSTTVYLGNEAHRRKPTDVIPPVPPLENSWEEAGVGVLCTNKLKKKKVQSDSGDGEDGTLPLPPPLLLLLQLARGLGEEHHVLFALDLALEELEGGAVEPHHVLKHTGEEEEVRTQQTGSDDEDDAILVFPDVTHSDLPHF